MASQIVNYQCPNCTGPLHFVGSSGKLECDYCGESFDVAEIEALYAAKSDKAEAAGKEAQIKEEQKAGKKAKAQAEASAEGWDLSELEQWDQKEAPMKAYLCPSCGAELICDETTAATSCPYCGNPTVVPSQFAETLKPDYVIPFKLDRDQAIAALKQHYKGKLFLPSAFKKENQIEEIKGMYVPFWMFDSKAHGDLVFEATRSETHREGDYEVTNTHHFHVYRSGNVALEKIPADGSSRMPDDLMDSLEPYDYNDLKKFSTAYMPGFLADKYDVAAKDCAIRADKRTAATLQRCLEDTVTGYATVQRIREGHQFDLDRNHPETDPDIRLRRGKVHYAMLPVWMLTTRWGGKAYTFAMNGQTGKFVGDLPTSAGRFMAALAALSAVGIAIFTRIATAFLL